MDVHPERPFPSHIDQGIGGPEVHRHILGEKTQHAPHHGYFLFVADFLPADAREQRMIVRDFSVIAFLYQTFCLYYNTLQGIIENDCLVRNNFSSLSIFH